MICSLKVARVGAARLGTSTSVAWPTPFRCLWGPPKGRGNRRKPTDFVIGEIFDNQLSSGCGSL